MTDTEFHRHLRAGRILPGATAFTPDPPELAARAVVHAVTTGDARVLVADPPRSVTPGDAGGRWGAGPDRAG